MYQLIVLKIPFNSSGKFSIPEGHVILDLKVDNENKFFSVLHGDVRLKRDPNVFYGRRYGYENDPSFDVLETQDKTLVFYDTGSTNSFFFEVPGDVRHWSGTMLHLDQELNQWISKKEEIELHEKIEKTIYKDKKFLFKKLSEPTRDWTYFCILQEIFHYENIEETEEIDEK